MKTENWIDNHKMEMFHLLTQYFKEFKKNNYNFILPQSIKDRVKRYINLSTPLIEIFYDFYEKSDDMKQIIKLQDVVDNIFSSETYMKMTSREKRLYSRKYIYEFFKNNEEFSKYYYERKRVDGIDYKNILIGFLIRNDF